MSNKKDVPNSLKNDIEEIAGFDPSNDEKTIWNASSDPEQVDNSLKNDLVEIDDSDFDNAEKVVENESKEKSKSSWLDSKKEELSTRDYSSSEYDSTDNHDYRDYNL